MRESCEKMRPYLHGDFNFTGLAQNAPVESKSGAELLLGVAGEVEVGTLDRRPLLATGAEPAHLAVALVPGGGRRLHVHALAALAAVGVVVALVAVLTPRPVVQTVAPALGQQVTPVAAAVLLVLRLCDGKNSQFWVDENLIWSGII